LPTPVALTAGAEVGVALLVGTYADDIMCIPIFAKIAWHPNLELVDNLDLYLTLKLGYNINLSGDTASTYYYEYKYGGGFSYGGNVGVRYFFSPSIGVFGELGYDRYAISYEQKAKISGYTSYSYKYYIYTWFHAGVTFLF